MQIFKEILFFKAMHHTKTNKQFTYYLLPVGFLRKEEGTRDVLFVCFCTVRSFEKEDFLENSHHDPSAEH